MCEEFLEELLVLNIGRLAVEATNMAISQHKKFYLQIAQEQTQRILESGCRRFIREIYNRLILNWLVEQYAKKLTYKVVRRKLYQIIQESVSTVYTLEEDTISLANTLLDGFIVHSIEKSVEEEVALTEDSLEISLRLVDSLIQQTVKAAFTQEQLAFFRQKMSKPQQKRGFHKP